MSFIRVGHDPSTGAILTVGGVRVLGLRPPVTLSSVGEPNNPRLPRNPSGAPRNPPHGPTSQAAPTHSSQVTPYSYAEPAPLGAPQNPPEIERAESAPQSAPQNKPPPMYRFWWG